MGLAAADTKGQAAKGAVWVKMNVKEKSTGVPDAWGSRRRMTPIRALASSTTPLSTHLSPALHDQP